MIKFIKKLFCKHEWIQQGRMVPASGNKRIIRCFGKKCSKCGKEIKY